MVLVHSELDGGVLLILNKLVLLFKSSESILLSFLGLSIKSLGLRFGILNIEIALGLGLLSCEFESLFLNSLQLLGAIVGDLGKSFLLQFGSNFF